MAKKVTTIPATKNRFDSTPVFVKKKRRVAGYARVSTDLEEQQSSYENQVEYYTNYINGREDWELVSIYTDEGITATNTKHRNGFNQMIEDALAGKIDLIVTKSVSRFARNTVDSLTTVRKLKEKGIEIYFEKENIWTLDSKGELLITIMSSLAQEESRSISENTTWGKRKSFADGKASIAYTRFLGYDKGFKINKEEAATVQMIYRLFLGGMSLYGITKEMEKRGVTSSGGGKRWYVASVRSILTNEKYKGDALLQKEYTTDFLTKKRKKNEGEIQQYYVEGHHEAIIAPETFDLVQNEMQKRYGYGKKYSSVTLFSSKVKCGECGGFYGSKVWHSTDKYRKVVYRCNRKYHGDKKCSTPYLTEDEIKVMFIKAMNSLLDAKEEVLGNLEELRQMVGDTAALESEREILYREVEALELTLRHLIDENARMAQSQEEFEKKSQSAFELYEQKQEKIAELDGRIEKQKTQVRDVKSTIDNLKSLDGQQTEFREELFAAIVDYLTVYNLDKVVFTFKGGFEITVSA